EAQAESRARVLISQSIDASELATLKGNLRPEVNPENDGGPVTDGLRMEHMLLQLQRPPELEKDLQQFIDELHNPASPDFHLWVLLRKQLCDRTRGFGDHLQLESAVQLRFFWPGSDNRGD